MEGIPGGYSKCFGSHDHKLLSGGYNFGRIHHQAIVVSITSCLSVENMTAPYESRHKG